MKKLILLFVCFCSVIGIMQNDVWSQANEASFELEKVIGSIYVGRQIVPVDSILGTGEGTYLMTNLYVIASEDRREVVLIDLPGLPELLTPLVEALETEFPLAEIKGVFLTHGHLDHCWSVYDFLYSGIPVYASSAEINASPYGPYGLPLNGVAIPIEPGDNFQLGDSIVSAVKLVGHTPGHMGYAYYPNGYGSKVNWFFAGDAIIAPVDHGTNDDPFNITDNIRQDILDLDTYNPEIWKEGVF